MGNLNLYSDSSVTTTAVPNIFIDEYMTNANGEYVKIYLYLLRCISNPVCNFSLCCIADHFECTEKDVTRALKYWAKRGLLRLEYDDNKAITGIFISNNVESETARTSVQTVSLSDSVASTVAPQPAEQTNVVKSRIYTADETKMLCSKEDVSELIFVAETYIGKALTHTDLNTILFWYDELKLPADVIEYIVETTVSGGHKSVRYMQKIAFDYAEKDIRTLKAAKAYSDNRRAPFAAVIKVFGIRDRSLSPNEERYISKWSGTWGFSAEIIAEACQRTIDATHKPEFRYANTILDNWYKQNARTLEDIKKLDAAYASANQPKTPKRQAGQFNNFKSRNNNYEDLQRQLLMNSMK